MMTSCDLPELGIGIVYSSGLEPLLLESGEDLVTVVEVEPQTVWHYAPGTEQPYALNEEARDRLHRLPQAKLVHGVGFPVGGTHPPDRRHIPPLVEAIQTLGSPWASEHLGFNRAVGPRGAFNTGFLLPPLQTPAGVEAAAASVRAVADRLPVPFAIETGVSYLQPRPGEMSDGAFMAAVAEAADCGILLDIHNLWANEQNGRQPVENFFAEIPRDRVWEVHIAGGIEYHEYWLDAHSGAIPEPLLPLARQLLPMLPNLRAIIFEILPVFVARLGLDGVRAQLEIVRDLWEHRKARAPIDRETPGTRPALDAVRQNASIEVPSPRAWEDALGALVIGTDPDVEEPLVAELRADPGVEILQKLVWDFRAGTIVDTLKLTCRLLLLYGGEPFMRELLSTFFRTSPPELFGSAEADAFASYLEARAYDVPYLPEVVGFEHAALRVLTDEESRVVPFRYEPKALLGALAQGRLPDAPPEGSYEVEVTPDASPDRSILEPLLGSM